MRRSLRWTLGGALALTAWVLWRGEGGAAPRLVAPVVRSPAADAAPTAALPALAPPLSPSLSASFALSLAHPSLPQALEPLQLDLAKRNIFAPHSEPVPVPKAPAPAPTAVLALSPTLEPPPPPAAPPMLWRYLGRMQGPDGRQVLVGHFEQAQGQLAGNAGLAVH